MNDEMRSRQGKEVDTQEDHRIPSSILIPSPIFALVKTFRSISMEEAMKAPETPSSNEAVSSPVPQGESRRPSAPTPEHPKNRALLRDCFVFQPILQDDER